MNLLLVCLGGAAGSALRYLVGLGMLRLAGGPWGTLAVNVIGSLLMGMLFHLLSGADHAYARLLLMTGVLGGFTTFSAFSLETAQLWMRGEIVLCLAYVLASVAISLAALALGLWLARQFG